MNFEEFKRILTTFADRPANVDISRGNLLVEVHDDVIAGEIFTKDGTLYVRENDTEAPAYQWLIKRVARLPLLAGRMLDYIPEENHFVTPSSTLLDQLEENPTDQPVNVRDSVIQVRQILGRRPGGTSSVLYLTSDAGEGKTTLINKVARDQARAYKNKEEDWLLIPILLGGRPFLRFDDVVIGELVNRFRFQFFFYDAFIELVKLGVIVPAFDGFEEMFVESSSGEALSALGNLMNSLQSSGSVLISARKAYFEYKSFATQAKLYDSLESNSVSFSKLSLNRWTRDQFMEYCRKRNVMNGEAIYNDVSHRLSDSSHPLLTRAVLVKRLIDITESINSHGLLLEKLGYAPHEYFYQFVDTIIEREVTEKWIDRSGQPARPLLTKEEHHELLSLLAQEMWSMDTEHLKYDVLDLLAELFSEAHRKSPTVARQVKERLKQHALISNVANNKLVFSFDHEEFRNFFLGQAIGRRIVENNNSDLRQLLGKGQLPHGVYDAAIQYLRIIEYNSLTAVETLHKLSKADIITSFTRDNCGGLIIRLIDGFTSHGLSVGNVNFPQYSLRGRNLNGINFTDCYFQSSPLDVTTINSCNFIRCRFDSLELSPTSQIQNVMFSECEVTSVIAPGNDSRVFDPLTVNQVLANAGITISVPENANAALAPMREPDERLQLVERALRIFIRSTQVHESVFRTKLGSRSSYFFNSIVPELIEYGVLVEVPGAGGGNNSLRYRLGVQMREIDEALSRSNGDFSNFLVSLSR